MLVFVKESDAFARLQFDRQDLVFEVTFFDCADGAAVALDCEGILFFAADLPLRGDVFSGDTHMHGFEGIGQCADHHVNDRGVAHALAGAQRRQKVASAAHRFGTAAETPSATEDYGTDGYDSDDAPMPKLGSFAVMNRTIEIAQAALARHQLAAYPPDLLIEIPRTTCRSLDFHRADEVIAVGRELASGALDSLSDGSGDESDV
jgi:predicted acylesterase/phospholipase RssA